jgi:hypothetical protein
VLKTEHFVADNSSVKEAIKCGAKFYTSALFGQQNNSWHVLFRDSYYQGKPDHAASTHQVYYMLMR